MINWKRFGILVLLGGICGTIIGSVGEVFNSPLIAVFITSFFVGMLLGWRMAPWIMNDTDIVFGVKWSLGNENR